MYAVKVYLLNDNQAWLSNNFNENSTPTDMRTERNTSKRYLICNKNEAKLALFSAKCHWKHLVSRLVKITRKYK